jgi:hypothetical protein
MDKRIDWLTAIDVDVALDTAATHGFSAGVLALHENRLHLRIVQRILIDGGQRRGGGAVVLSPLYRLD